jgi:hypothetical protein
LIKPEEKTIGPKALVTIEIKLLKYSSRDKLTNITELNLDVIGNTQGKKIKILDEDNTMVGRTRNPFGFTVPQ